MILIYMEGKFIDLSDLVIQGLPWQGPCPCHHGGKRRQSWKIPEIDSRILGCDAGKLLILSSWTPLFEFRRVVALSTASCSGRQTPTHSSWLRTGRRRRTWPLTPPRTTSWPSSLRWAPSGARWSWALKRPSKCTALIHFIYYPCLIHLTGNYIMFESKSIT